MSYQLRAAETTEAELDRLAALLERAFPRATHLRRPYLRWLYVENPRGAVLGTNAWHEGALVGHYAVIPLAARCDGQAVRAALSLNTAVHPAHRGRQLFTRLAEATYERARRLGVEQVVGVSNRNSTPGFVRRLGFHDLGPLDAHLLLRPPRLRERPWPPPAWERIWEPADLRWRVANPVARYTLERCGGAYAILAPTGLPGIRAVLTLHPDGAEPALALPVVRYHGLRLWLGRSQRFAPSGLGTFPLPARLRPSPLNFIFRWLEPGGETPDPARLEFCPLDFDVY